MWVTSDGDRANAFKPDRLVAGLRYASHGNFVAGDDGRRVMGFGDRKPRAGIAARGSVAEFGASTSNL